MLMGWGPFRFTVLNYSVETIRRSLQSRAEDQPIIGAAPSIHRLGPGLEEITLESTFHPKHMNGNGMAQLAGIRQAVNAQIPMTLVHINGNGRNIVGNWLAVSVSNEETMIDSSGTPQAVTASLSLKNYEQSPARRIAASVGIGMSFGLDVSVGDFSASVRLGF